MIIYQINLNLLENTFDSVSFKTGLEVIFDQYKSDVKVKGLNTKIVKELKKELVFENIKSFINTEFNKPENLGKVIKFLLIFSYKKWLYIRYIP